MHRNHGRWIGLGLAILASALLLPAGAEAQSKKTFSAHMGNAVLAQGVSGDVHGRITNWTTGQTLGSADAIAPAHFTLNGVSGVKFYDAEGKQVGTPAGATVTRVGNRIEFRGVDLQYKEYVTFTASVTPSGTACGNFLWDAAAKQANDFKGTGNDFFLLQDERTSLGTAVSQDCGLEFKTQPQDARVGESISTGDYDPAAGAIEVELLGSPGAGTVVELELVPVYEHHRGVLGGTTSAVQSGGVASFAAATVDAPGLYKLRATSSDGDSGSAESDQFAIESNSSWCAAGAACTATTERTYIHGEDDSHGGDGGTVTLQASKPIAAEEGFLTVSLFADALHQCNGYTSPLLAMPGDAKVDGPHRPTTVVLTFDQAMAGPTLLGAEAEAKDLEACFAAPIGAYTFLAKTGHSLVDGDGDGELDHIAGLLPDCGTAVDGYTVVEGVTPCVKARFTVDGLVTRIGYTAVLPDGPDPQWG